MSAIAASLAFVARRLMQAALVMLAILIIAFAVRSALGDPLREIMGEAGVKSAVCVNQEVGNVSLDDRCNGFKDGLAKTGGKIEVVAVRYPEPAGDG